MNFSSNFKGLYNVLQKVVIVICNKIATKKQFKFWVIFLLFRVL